jgi:hypothetical protein
MDHDDTIPEPGRPNPEFLNRVMQGLAETNFVRGWTDRQMYQDFLQWCESSEEADSIITQFFPEVPSLLVDPDEGVRVMSLRASVATDLMKALLERFEEERIQEFLER